MKESDEVKITAKHDGVMTVTVNEKGRTEEDDVREGDFYYGILLDYDSRTGDFDIQFDDGTVAYGLNRRDFTIKRI